MLTYRNLLPQHGFTLVELVTVIIILGVLAAAAMPLWFNRTQFDERGFTDELLQATRYVQKLAVASNCDARITISAGSFMLEQPDTYCNTSATWHAISLPEMAPPYATPSGVAITSATTTITFHGSGTATLSNGSVISINGTPRMQIFPATGYVERL